jgi:lipid-binding SYLF domain-containing protein
MFKRNQFFIMAFTFVLLVGSLGLRALSAKESANEDREQAQKAATVLSEIMGIPEEGIPNDLMSRAEAVAVFPGVVKGAFIVGGEYGKGLVSRRMENGRWSTPSFIKIGGGSVGFQIGGSSTDVVLVFTSRDGFKGLLNGKVKLGADAAVAAGPVGRNAQVATDVMLKSPVLAYSRSKGLFAGIALDGAVVSIDESANKKAYGKDITADDILYHGKAQMNDIVSPFVRELDKDASPSKRTTD